MSFKKSDLTHCPNCGEEYLEDAHYCHHCGQINRDLNLPIRHWISDFFDTFFNIDGRFYNALKLIVLQPGKLTSEFNAGRRVSYIPPFRIYLITSLLFFLFQSFLFTKGEVEKNMKQIEKTLGDTTEFNANMGAISIKTNANELSAIKDMSDEALDSFMRANDIEITFINRASLRGTSRLLTGSGMYQYNQILWQNFSKMMFFLMPVFAFLLWLFFRKKLPYYTQHLVFSIHFHTAMFIVLIIYALISFFIKSNSPIASFIPMLVSFFYLTASIKNVFSLRWGRATANALGIGLIYGLILLFSASIVAVISIFYLA